MMDQSFLWDALLEEIEEQSVIPIIGKELTTVHSDSEDVLLERYIAQRLAEELGIKSDELSSQFGINEVARQHIKNGGKANIIYSRINTILKKHPIQIPEALNKLAAITDFKLFVSLGFDSLLEEAINRQRFAGEQKARSLRYSREHPIIDLPSDEPKLLDNPYVYHLFGFASTAMDYAVTDWELLEYLHHLQSEHPGNLFEAFRRNHLLFIGCGFENWLERFVIRCITNERLDTVAATSRFVVDDRAQRDPRLTLFLKDYATQVFSGGPAEFVDTLHAKWLQQHPSARPTVVGRDIPSKMESGAIFLSYAREDLEAARNMQQALEKEVEVWFDKEKLDSGDAWDRKLRHNILHCTVFIPLISRQAQQRGEGYFRKEWYWAIERSKTMDNRLRFIQPVVVDDIPDNAEGIAPEFWGAQAMRFHEGRPTPEFVASLKQLVRDRRIAEAGR